MKIERRNPMMVAALAVALSGCVSEQQVGRNASRTPAAPARPSSVTQTMQRQVSNAVDAGDGDAVVRSLRKRLVADPNNADVRMELAEHYEKAGYPDLAIEHLRLAAAHFPGNPTIAMRLAKSLRDFGQAAEAVATLDEFCKRNTLRPPELLSLLGILRDDAGAFAQAEPAYREALAQAPNQAYLHNNLGYNLLLQSRPKEAADEFRAALAIEPHSELANDNLGLALLEQWKTDEQPKEALLRWESVGGPATAHNNLATVLMEQHRYAEARKELEIALGSQKDHPAALANLKLLTELDGKAAAASKEAGRSAASTSLWKRVTLSVQKAWTGSSKSHTAPEPEPVATKQ